MLNFINCRAKQLVNRVYFLLLFLSSLFLWTTHARRQTAHASLTFIFAGLHTKEFNTLNSNLLPSQPDFLLPTADGEKVRQSPCRVRCIVRHVLHIYSNDPTLCSPKTNKPFVKQSSTKPRTQTQGTEYGEPCQATTSMTACLKGVHSCLHYTHTVPITINTQ